MNNERHFVPFVLEFDRYNPEKLLKAWQEADKSGEIITVDDIEVNDYKESYDTMMQSFWKNICQIDNYVQQYGADHYKMEDGKVDLAWLSTEEDGVFLAYWGVHVNLELRAVCKYKDDAWNVTEIWYC